MKKKGNIRSYAVCAAVTLLTACAANPVEEVKTTTTTVAPLKEKIVTKATNKVVAVKKPEVKIVQKVAIATAPKVKPVRKVVVAPVQKKVVVKPKITAKQAQARKRQIIAMAKPKPKRVVVQRKVAPKKTVVRKPVAPVRVAKAAPRVVRKVVKVKKPVVVARTKPRVIPKPVVRTQRVAPKPAVRYAANRQVNNQYRKVAHKPTPRPVRAVVAKRKITRIDPDQSFGYALSNAAIDRAKHKVRYDGSYVKIGYPWGDVPKSIGVCTDVVIRAYRKLGIDLQQEVHKDISSDFYAYPNLAKWGLTKPDPNIDHRRVYNLQAFFKRHKAELPRSRNPKDYKPGDLVTWMIGPSFPHIGIVVNKPSKADPNRLMISHNIGYGPKVEDILFRFPMTGHYRYTPKNRKVNPALHFAKTPAPASVRRQNAMDYNDLLEASRRLLGDDNKVPQQKPVLHVKQQTEPARINLAQLDAATLNALLKN